MTTVAVIPARYGSTRFPAKALACETGKYLVQHVYERVTECRALDRVIVATDDDRIIHAVRSFGGEVQLTRADHVSGTDRVAEVAASLNLADDDLVLNVQGDEPDLHPSVLDQLVARFGAPSARSRISGRMESRLGMHAEDCRIGTIAARFEADAPKEGPGSPMDPNRVKVVVDHRGRALYFSRSAIPFPRSSQGVINQPSRWLLHMGVYAFRSATLREITGAGGLPVGELEIAESLEQLRWMEAGYSIAVVLVTHAFVGVDTPEDYAAFKRRYGSNMNRSVPRACQKEPT